LGIATFLVLPRMRFSLTLRLRVAQKELKKTMRCLGVAALFSIFS
jgi:hypothetical protein